MYLKTPPGGAEMKRKPGTDRLLRPPRPPGLKTPNSSYHFRSRSAKRGSKEHFMIGFLDIPSNGIDNLLLNYHGETLRALVGNFESDCAPNGTPWNITCKHIVLEIQSSQMRQPCWFVRFLEAPAWITSAGGNLVEIPTCMARPSRIKNPTVGASAGGSACPLPSFSLTSIERSCVRIRPEKLAAVSLS